MDVTLHLGAHRTASTCFQYYLRENAVALEAAGIAAWGPWRTRDGLLTGVIPVTGITRPPAEQLGRARGRIALALQEAERRRLRHVIVSDENMIGAARRNLRDRRLYAHIGERLARFAHAFEGRISRVVLSPRAQDSYWASAIAFSVGRGHKVPGSDDLDRLVTGRRSWRDVISDVACALPGVEVLVMPYERFGGLPEVKLRVMTGLENPPMTHAREWINRAPSLAQLRQILRDRDEDPAQLPQGEGRWHPFDDAQTMALREAYADDQFWLHAGAGGLATLIEETGTGKTGQNPQPDPRTKRGQDDGYRYRRLA